MPIVYRFAAIADAADNIQVTAKTVRGMTDDLNGYLANLRGSWQGQGRDSWQARQNDWNTAADELHAILHQLGSITNAAILTNMGNTENSIVQSFGG
jgi:WXG100 family type VII secretion target